MNPPGNILVVEIALLVIVAICLAFAMWRDRRHLRGKKMRELSSQELMQICDVHFLTAEEIAGKRDELPHRDREPYGRYIAAFNELWKRGGAEVREWARGLLTHPDFDARECGAGLLARVDERGLLGDMEEQIIAELGVLIQRPMEEDAKEQQAVSAALSALSKIGNPQGIAHIRWILFSTAPEHQGDTQWNAAEELSALVGEAFMSASDPVEAAREWLRAHPA